jgi:hypothetical protein
VDRLPELVEETLAASAGGDVLDEPALGTGI